MQQINAFNYWKAYTLADMIGALIGFTLYGFYVSYSWFHLIWSLPALVFIWYVYMLYLPLQVLYFYTLLRKSGPERYYRSYDRLIIFILHSAITFGAWALGGESLHDLPYFIVSWISVFGCNLLAFMILRNAVLKSINQP